MRVTRVLQRDVRQRAPRPKGPSPSRPVVRSDRTGVHGKLPWSHEEGCGVALVLAASLRGCFRTCSIAGCLALALFCV